MSSTRPRRSAAAPPAPPTPSPLDSSRRSRPSRNVKSEPEPKPAPEPEVEAEEELTDEEVEAEAEDEEPEAEIEAGPSRSRGRGGRQRGRGRGRGGAPARGSSRRTADEDEEDEEKPYHVRSRKSVSYREVPVEVSEDEGEEDGDGEDEEQAATPPPRKSSQAPDTPSRRRKATTEDPEKEDKPYRLEKVGSGRGGFSVKGAAAAAARARWAKVRREKAERGEEDDGDRKRSRTTVRRENRAAVEKLKDGEVINIRGVDYIAHNDELPLPDDVKGEAKIDAEGRLKGDREYRVFTFSSEGRDNNERLYALTIDVARALGFSDSLAFLRKYPVIQKLQCQSGEAEMLIENGRVSGNMRQRMVTIIPIRNVFKLMGARIIKDAKWVTDDYYEDEALAKCAENGYTPYAPVQEEEIMVNAHATSGAMTRAEREREALNSALKSSALSPFYTIGGPSTHFGGAGIDPWTEGGWGNRRAKLRGYGVTEDDWMYRTALESRVVDASLRQYRQERIGILEGDDLKGWVWMMENKAEEDETAEVEKDVKMDSNPMAAPGTDHTTLGGGLKPPLDRKRSALSREVTFEPELDLDIEEHPSTDEALTPLAGTDADADGEADGDADISMEVPEIVEAPGPAPAEEAENDNDHKDPLSAALDTVNGQDGKGDVIRVETAEELIKRKTKWSFGTGSWAPGTIKAAYEPHTHMPHVSLSTQPTSADFVRASPYPILQSLSDGQRHNFVQSTVRGSSARGLASVEYVFEPFVDGRPGWTRTSEEEDRKKVVDDAIQWEKEQREKAKKRRIASTVV